MVKEYLSKVYLNPFHALAGSRVNILPTFVIRKSYKVKVEK